MKLDIRQKKLSNRQKHWLTHMPLAFLMIVLMISSRSAGSSLTWRDSLRSLLIRPSRYLSMSLLVALISNVASASMSSLMLSISREVTRRFTVDCWNWSSSRKALRASAPFGHSSSASIMMKTLLNFAIVTLKRFDSSLSEGRMCLPRCLR